MHYDLNSEPVLSKKVKVVYMSYIRALRLI